ncbi:MAG: SGNH/GDSL hydrolase family protein [Roseobacter sp.]
MQTISMLKGIVAAIALCGTSFAQADTFKSPDILVLGDSQISFGSGPVFVDFLSDIEKSCGPNNRDKRKLKKLGDMSVGVIGVRSTSIHSWVARKGAAKGSICNVDPKWKVNAGTYGVVNKTKNQFKQMGQGRNYQFCTSGKSPFEAMFEPNYYTPKILIMAFLGNAARRWADHPDLALADAKKLSQHLPADLPCVFMTTAPAHTTKVAKLRSDAQKNIKAAFEKTGNRCTFVEGITPETTAVNQSTKAFFRRRDNGSVKDPYHPNQRGARHHLKLRGPALCEAIFDSLDQKPKRS